MRDERPTPLAGVFRFLYLVAVLTATLAVVLTAVFAFYEAPDSGDEYALEYERQYERQGDSAQADYERNIGLILTLIGTGTMTTAILGLGGRANALRSGVLLAGVGLFGGGIGVGFGGSDNWVTVLISGFALATLAGTFAAVENGLPIAIARTRGDV